MTIVACAIAVDSVEAVETSLRRAEQAVNTGAHLVEWRIDGLASETELEPALNAIQQLIDQCPSPCVVTCRAAAEGGEYERDEADRVALLQRIIDLEKPPRYVDVELSTFQQHDALRTTIADLAARTTEREQDDSPNIILSMHDFQGRPAGLWRQIENMAGEEACKIIKIAWHARSLRDNLEVFDLLSERTKPTIALGMGRFGLMSRVLAGKFGGFVTYAALSREEITAPGQPTIDELFNLYQFSSIKQSTQVYGIIGWPVEQSLSPAVHNRGFHIVGHDGVYLPMPVGPEYEPFKATVGSLIDHARLGFRGASVTVPHKENLLRFVKEHGGRTDPLTERIGAANTLTVGSAGGLACRNTDCPAAMEALREGMGLEQSELAGKNVAVLGAGGAARAVAVGLLDAGAHVVVFNRTKARAIELTEELQSTSTPSDGKASIAVGDTKELAGEPFHIYINCTPIGMAGSEAPEQSPLEALNDSDRDVPIDDSVTVFDTVYNPVKTKMLADAESRGARIITGLEMFLKQAAMQFREWTGVDLPAKVREQDQMTRALRHLAGGE